MARLPWLQRESTNRDAVLVAAVFVVVPLILGGLNATEVIRTMPLAGWVAVALIAPLTGSAYKRGQAAAAESVPPAISRYVEHTTDAIDTLQLILMGEIHEPITVDDFVKEGIFEPAHGILSQASRGDVRFSILQPEDQGDHFAMLLAQGHSIESRRLFRLRIAGSFAGMTFADGNPRVSNDTLDDDRFTPHPEARPGREYRSIVAAPIRDGHRVEGVFVVVAQNPNGFGEAEVAYVRELAAIVSLARAVTAYDDDPSDATGTVRGPS